MYLSNFLLSRKIYFPRQWGLQRGSPFAALMRVLKDAEHLSKGTLWFPSLKKVAKPPFLSYLRGFMNIWVQ